MNDAIKKVTDAAVVVRKAFGQYDESKHPRHPKGSAGGGKFAPKGGGGSVSPATDSPLVSKEAWSNAQAWHKLASRSYDRAVRVSGYDYAKRSLAHHKKALAAFERADNEQMVNQYKARVKKLQRRVNKMWRDITA